jgi:hypothetical protein
MLRVARAHVEARTIVIEDYKLVYLPIPKAGWTAMLWALAPLAGLSADSFAQSRKPEISPEMAVHDMLVWAQHGRLLFDLDPARRAEIVQDPDWLRFTVVRDPARRLWSAWQSKILLQEPVYYGFHRDKDWFPRPPVDAADVVDDFHAFIRAMSEGIGSDPKMHDAHWGPQTDSVDLVPLNHIGRFEDPVATRSVLQEHISALGGPALVFERANASALPYDPVVYDEPSLAIVNRIYSRDYAELGYPQVSLPSDTDFAQWASQVEPEFAHLRELIARHQRLYTLVEAYRAELRVTRAAVRRLERRLTRANDKRRAAARQRRKAVAQRDLARQRYEQTTSSFSWRVTAPLRRLRSRRRGS